MHPVFGPEPVSKPTHRRRHGEEDQRGRYQFIDREGLTNDGAEQMCEQSCRACSAFLAYRERPQWIWFAVLAVLAEIGGAMMLAAVRAQRLTY
ncbi:hypothetical protein V1294_004493 [Bradyrhizobium sp. AZCC 1678]|uniref:hypothetical protein n=1 Tax=Bradyrhizobium sp. AZCC 1678 TaxID=3117030 RepID=UPI002FF0C8EF